MDTQFKDTIFNLSLFSYSQIHRDV